MDDWDPCREDYEDEHFNSYDRGPGKHMERNMREEGFTLYVGGIPLELTEDGMCNLFSSCGEVLNVKKCFTKRPDLGCTYGFVTMQTKREGLEVLRRFQGYKIDRHSLRIQVAMTDEKYSLERERKKREQEFRESLPSVRMKQIQGKNKENSYNKGYLSSDQENVDQMAGQLTRLPLGRGRGGANLPVQDVSTISAYRGNGNNNKNTNNNRVELQPGYILKNYPLHHSGGHHQAKARLEQSHNLIHTTRRAAVLKANAVIKSNVVKAQKKVDCRACSFCGVFGQFQCSGCYAPYCSVLCQTSDWPQHKHQCHAQQEGHREEENTEFDVTVDEAIIEAVLLGTSQKALPKPVSSAKMGKPTSQAQDQSSSMCRQSAPSQKTRVVTKVTSPVSSAPAPQIKEVSHVTPTFQHLESRSLPIGESRQVLVVVANTPHDIWVQETDGDKVKAIEELTRAINTQLQSLRAVDRAQVGHIYAAKQACDGQWYRARCEEVQGSGTDMSVTVRFVDYGNTEVVSIKDLRHMKKEMLSLPAMAIPCALHGLVPLGNQETWPKTSLDVFKQVVVPSFPSNVLYVAMTMDIQDGCHHVILNDTEGNDVESLLLQCKAVEKLEARSQQRTDTVSKEMRPTSPVVMNIPETPAEPQPPEQKSPDTSLPSSAANSSVTENSINYSSLPLNVETQVLVVVANTPHDIWVQETDGDKVKAIEELAQAINTQLQSLKAVDRAQVGHFYAAKQACDGQWYRARCEEVQGSGTDTSVTVRFVDYGNTEVVSIKDLRHVKKEMLSLPAMAIPCALHGLVPPGNQETWPKTSLDVFKQVVVPSFPSNVLYVAMTMDIQDGRHHVILNDTEGTDIESLLLQYEVAEKLEARSQQNRRLSPDAGLPSNTTDSITSESSISYSSLPLNAEVEVLVVVANTPHDIWVQETDGYKVKAIEELTRDINTQLPSLGAVDRAQVGHIYAAKQACDGQWYRARCEEVQGSGTDMSVTVRFVDYGNTEVVSIKDLRHMKKEMLSLPALAIPCALHGLVPPGNQETWPKTSLDVFRQVVVPSYPSNVLYVAMTMDIQDGHHHVILNDTQGTDIESLLVQCKAVEKLEAISQQRTDTVSKETRPTSPVVMNIPETPAEPQPPVQKVTTDISPASAVQSNINYSSLPLNVEVQVVVIAAVSPGEIWVQHYDPERLTQMYAITDEIAEELKGLRAVGRAQVGHIYAAKQACDGRWYRARCEEVQGSGTDTSVSVRFVDYGNTEVVSHADLRELQPKWCSEPCAGICCALDGVPHDANTRWLPADLDKFHAILPASEKSSLIYKACAIRVDNGRHFIKLSSSQAPDVAVALTNAGLVTRSDKSSPNKAEPSPSPKVKDKSSPMVLYSSLPIGVETKVIVTEVVSPVEIWVQEGDANKLTTVAALTKEIGDQARENLLAPVVEPVIGDLYAAIQSCDKDWYRACCEECLSDGKVLVTFIDFGNKEVVNMANMRELLPFMKEIPVSGVHCCLAGLRPTDGSQIWSEETLKATKRLVPLTDECQSMYEAVVVSMERNVAHIRLMDGLGVDVASKLVDAGIAIQGETIIPVATTLTRPSMEGHVGPVSTTSTTPSQEGPVSTTSTPPSQEGPVSTTSTTPSQEGLIGPSSTTPLKEENESPVGVTLSTASLTEGIRSPVGFMSSTTSSTKPPQKRISLESTTPNAPLEEESKSQVGVTLLTTSLRASSAEEGMKSPLPSEQEKISISNQTQTTQASLVLDNKSGPVMAKEVKPADFQLRPGDHLTAVVTVFKSPLEFYVQVYQDAMVTQWARLCDRLNEEFHATSEGYRPSCVGELVLAEFTEDHKVYRAKVCSLSHQQACVHFLDFGNDQKCEFSALRPASRDHTLMPQQALECCLHGVDPSVMTQQGYMRALEAMQVQINNSLNTGFPAVFRGVQFDKVCLELFDASTKDSLSCLFCLSTKGIKEYTVMERQAQAADADRPQDVGQGKESQGVVVQEAAPGGKKRGLSLPLGQKVQVGITHVNGLDSFYVQLNAECHQQTREEIQSCLSDISQAPVCTGPPAGTLVWAQFSGDQAWYRAQVLDCHSENCRVFYVDFGNTEDAVPWACLRDLDPQCARLPWQAVHCSLHRTSPEEGPDEKDFVSRAQNLLVEVTVREVNEDKGQYCVDVFTLDGEHLNQLLTHTDAMATSGSQDNKPRERQLSPSLDTMSVTITESLKELKATSSAMATGAECQRLLCDVARTELEVNAQTDVIVSHVDSPVEFYCQRIEDLPTLQVLMNDIMLHSETCDVDDSSFSPKTGEVVCALFSEDKNWYRGTVLRVTSDNLYHVQYVDFGNTATLPLTDLRPALPSHLSVPVLAVKCALIDVLPLGSHWPQETAQWMFAKCQRKLQATVISLVQAKYHIHLDGLEAENGTTNIRDMLVEMELARRENSAQDGGRGETTMPEGSVTELITSQDGGRGKLAMPEGPVKDPLTSQDGGRGETTMPEGSVTEMVTSQDGGRGETTMPEGSVSDPVTSQDGGRGETTMPEGSVTEMVTSQDGGRGETTMPEGSVSDPVTSRDGGLQESKEQSSKEQKEEPEAEEDFSREELLEQLALLRSQLKELQMQAGS